MIDMHVQAFSKVVSGANYDIEIFFDLYFINFCQTDQRLYFQNNYESRTKPELKTKLCNVN